MAYNRCVGTRYCANNCPYKVRRFNFLNCHKHDAGSRRSMVVQPRRHGPHARRDGKVHLLRAAHSGSQDQSQGRRAASAIKDGEIKTACQQTCPADAIVFGNINDPNSRVAKLKKQERNYALLAELNIKPRTTYLAKLRNPNPELS